MHAIVSLVFKFKIVCLYIKSIVELQTNCVLIVFSISICGKDTLLKDLLRNIRALKDSSRQNFHFPPFFSSSLNNKTKDFTDELDFSHHIYKILLFNFLSIIS